MMRFLRQNGTGLYLWYLVYRLNEIEGFFVSEAVHQTKVYKEKILFKI